MGKDYIELEYIESTGTQYIDTGISISANPKIETIIKFNKSDNTSLINNNCIFGINDSSVNKSFTINLGSDNDSNNTIFVWNGVGYSAGESITKVGPLTLNFLNSKHTYILDNTGLYIDSEYFQKTGVDTMTDVTIHIFTCKRKDGTVNSKFGIFYLYSFKIYNNDILVQDLIPVKRKSDNKICMYDKVSNTYFLNQGTGEFIAGPEIPEPTFYDSLLLINSKITNLLNLTDTILNKNPKVIPVEYDTYVTIESSPKYKVGINENATSLKILTYDDTSKYDRRAILKFDLSKYIFNINKISKVELWAYLFANDIPSRQQTHPVRRIIKDWNSDTLFDLTYMSNTIEDRMVSLNTSGSGYGWRTADITNLFKGWINNTYENYGLVIDNNRGQPEAGGYWASMQYYSKEADNDYKPKIVITYNK